MKILTAHTSETDDVEAAVAEILEQLDLSRLCRYSAGIMYYYEDFTETGVAKRICEALPFPVMGSTTSSSAVPGSPNDVSLTINVFTSDDTAFTAGISDPVLNEPFLPIEKLYKKLLEEKPESMGERPVMFYVILPNFQAVAGDDYLAVLNGLSRGIPVFGSVASTHTSNFTNIKTFFNGVEYDASMAILAFWGNVEPKFFISAIPDEQIIHKQAVITDSYKNRIIKVNGIPVLNYLESIGITKDGNWEEIASFPLVLHMPGGSRLIRSVNGAENGELLCSGSVPSHVPMEISFCDKDFVVKSARKTALECKNWLEAQGGPARAGAVIVSCVARRWALGLDVHAEIDEIASGLSTIPRHFVYSRGEFCPTRINNGTADNYFFNFSLCICVF